MRPQRTQQLRQDHLTQIVLMNPPLDSTSSFPPNGINRVRKQSTTEIDCIKRKLETIYSSQSLQKAAQPPSRKKRRFSNLSKSQPLSSSSLQKPSNKDFKVLISKANSFLQSKNPQKALDTVNQILKIEIEPNIKATQIKVCALSALYKFLAKSIHAHGLLEIDPKNIQALKMKATALAGLGNLKKSIDYVQKILEIDPKNAYALSALQDFQETSSWAGLLLNLKN